MEGTWIQSPDGWSQIGTEETTALAETADGFAIGTPTGIAWWHKHEVR